MHLEARKGVSALTLLSSVFGESLPSECMLNRVCRYIKHAFREKYMDFWSFLGIFL